MKFETTNGSGVHLSQGAAVLALVHLSDGGRIVINRVPEISDEEFSQRCKLHLPLGEHGTFIPPETADLIADQV